MYLQILNSNFILPIKNNTASIVWTESIQNAATISEMNEAEYLSVLQKRFGDFLGKLKLTGKRLSFPLKLSISEKYVSDKFAVIGDAAHGYHPIAGQGLNAGLRDIAALVDVISCARERGEDFSSINILNRYQENPIVQASSQKMRAELSCKMLQ